MTSFPTLTVLFVQKYSCPYNYKNTLVHIIIKRQLHGGLKISIIILFSRGKKQYFTHSLRSFVN